MLEFAEDIAVDIPHIWTNLGVILGPAVNAEALPLCDLKTLVEPLIPGNKAGLLMAETLAAASRISVRISLLQFRYYALVVNRFPKNIVPHLYDFFGGALRSFVVLFIQLYRIGLDFKFEMLFESI